MNGRFEIQACYDFSDRSRACERLFDSHPPRTISHRNGIGGTAALDLPHGLPRRGPVGTALGQLLTSGSGVESPTAHQINPARPSDLSAQRQTHPQLTCQHFFTLTVSTRPSCSRARKTSSLEERPRWLHAAHGGFADF